jgi:hypothetical protein
MRIDRKFHPTPENSANDYNGMTVEEMARAWNVPSEKIDELLRGVTISQKDPRTGADLIPWADVKEARNYFWYHDKGTVSRLD